MRHNLRIEKPEHGFKVGETLLSDGREFTVDGVFGDVVFAWRKVDEGSPALGERWGGRTQIEHAREASAT